MKSYFADTSFYLALVNPRDALHARALEHGSKLGGRLVTTAWIVQELADGLCSPGGRATFQRIFTAIERDRATTLLEPDQAPGAAASTSTAGARTNPGR